MKETRPFSMKDKIGYTLGDLGCCCTEQFRAGDQIVGCHQRSTHRCIG